MGTNKFPLGAVSLSIMLLLVLTGCITSPEALAKFSDNNVIIMGTMMITANAFGKTRAVKSIAKLLTKAGKGRWENAIRMFMVINFVLGFFLSGAIGRIAIVYPLAVAVCEENDISPSKVMFPLICCMLADQTGIPLGSGAVTYNKYNGYLAAAGYSFGDQFRMIDPFLCKAPLAIVMLLYFMFIGLKISPDHPSTAITGVNLKARKEDVLTSRQETIIYVTFILQCIGLVTASKTGIPQWIFTMGGALVVVMTKAIPVKQATDSIPFSIIFMYIGALAMGTALLNTGAGALIGKMVAGYLRTTSINHRSLSGILACDHVPDAVYEQWRYLESFYSSGDPVCGNHWMQCSWAYNVYPDVLSGRLVYTYGNGCNAYCHGSRRIQCKGSV